MADSMREALSQAYEELEESGSTEETVTPRSVTPIQSEEPVVKSLDKSGKPAEEPVVKPKAEEKPKFTKPDGTTAKPVGAKPAVKPVVDPNAPTPAAKFKAPQSWKPATREAWDKIPPEAQEEITRREADITRALSSTAAVRKFGEEFTKVVSPFEHLIRASGVNPLQAVQNLMTTAAGLQTGTPQQKAITIANIIKSYGVDIAILDQVLAGQKPKEGGQNDDALMRAIDQRLKPLMDFTNEVRGTRSSQEQALVREAQQTAEQFASDPANEFYEDLRADIADLLDLAASRGRELSLKDAYDLAAKAHPEISKVVAQREEANRLAKRASGVERARRAASSQPGGSPAGGVNAVGAKPKGIRGALSQAFDDLSST